MTTPVVLSGCRTSSSASYSRTGGAASGNFGHLQLEELPPELLERILCFLPFDGVSAVRLVSRTFDAACWKVLNTGFQRVERFHSRILEHIESNLPRRESERIYHPLSSHKTIVALAGARLTYLGLTYSRYIGTDRCCFIPGKVLDKLYAVLGVVNRSLDTKDEPQQRCHELLQELRDISSMAIEHFDEQIAPRLRETKVGSGSKLDNCLASLANGFTPSFYKHTQDFFSRCEEPKKNSDSVPAPKVARPTNLADEMCKLQKQTKEQAKLLGVYRKELSALKATTTRSSKKLAEQAKTIGELNRKLEEFSRKYDDMFPELPSEVGQSKHGPLGDAGMVEGETSKRRKRKAPETIEESAVSPKRLRSTKGKKQR